MIAPLSGGLSDRLGARVLASGGLLLTSLSLLLLSRLGPTATYANVLTLLLLLGIGSGLFQSPNNSSVMGSVGRARYGVAGGSLSMVRNLGTVTGVALAGAVLMISLGTVAGAAGLDALEVGARAVSTEQARLVSAFVQGMSHAYLIAAGIAAAGAIASLVRGGPVAEAAGGPALAPARANGKANGWTAGSLQTEPRVGRSMPSIRRWSASVSASPGSEPAPPRPAEPRRNWFSQGGSRCRYLAAAALKPQPTSPPRRHPSRARLAPLRRPSESGRATS